MASTSESSPKRNLILIAVSVVALAIALAVVILRSSDSASVLDTNSIYVYDLNASELTVGSIEEVPAAPESPAFAWASVYSCGECGGEEQFVGYLHQFAGGLLQQLRTVPESLNQAQGMMAQYQGPPQDHMIKRPNDPQWVPWNSPQGQEIRNEIQNQCGGDRPRPCSP